MQKVCVVVGKLLAVLFDKGYGLWGSRHAVRANAEIHLYRGFKQ